MSYKMNSSRCSLADDSPESSTVAKLRRLKIEENLLLNNINKMNLNEANETNSELPVIYSTELKNQTVKYKNYVSEIKNIFEDLKAMTEEKLNTADIDNMKRDVVKLDEKIRHLKTNVQTELAAVMSKEKELTKQLNDIDQKQTQHTFKPKIKLKPFNQIVPSPVKLLIQSPFKCKEVQNFQEFMMNSQNRYGGWTEYHHNVFVHIWQKHFECDEETASNESHELQILKPDKTRAFQKEILEKITGSTDEDIVAHCTWYRKYLYLKGKQQIALNKWKKKKDILSKSQSKQGACDNHNMKAVNVPKPNSNKVQVLTSIENVNELLATIETHNADEIADAMCDMDITLREAVSFDKEIDTNVDDKVDINKTTRDLKSTKRSFIDVLKPTKQWINRCNGSSEGGKEYYDLESIKKLRIPDWRLALQD